MRNHNIINAMCAVKYMKQIGGILTALTTLPWPPVIVALCSLVM